MNNIIQEFYDQVCFPGFYTQEELNYHRPNIQNPYLLEIDRSLLDANTILDVGCGSGLITNLFADRYPDKTFTAIDFSAGIDYAIHFSQQHNIRNTKFIKHDFTTFNTTEKFDTVICQGVLHHMPNYLANIEKLKDLVNLNGILVLGVYHPLGKLAKKYFLINYRNAILYKDQELNPYETAFSFSQIKKMLGNQYKLLHAYPSTIPILAEAKSLLNYRNGGLITSLWKKYD